MTDDPAQRILRGEGTPGDTAHLDQSRAEAAADLARLREAWAEGISRSPVDAVHTAFVLGLLKTWTPLTVATVLVEVLRKERE